MNKINWLITDFDRTLVQLFSDDALKEIRDELLCLYIEKGIDKTFLLHMTDPYEMWIATYKYLQKHSSPDQTTETHRIASSILTRAEIRAAKSATLMENVAITLAWLSDLNINCAIVSTNSTEAVKLTLEANKVSSIIPQVFGRDDSVPMEQLKPSPTLVQRALETLGAQPQHTIYIGDSKDDMIAGNAARIPVIGVLTGKTSANELLSFGAHIILSDFSALREINHLFGMNDESGSLIT